jgi:hypothetical protein
MAKMPDGVVEEIVGNLHGADTAVGHVQRIVDAARAGRDVGSAITAAQRDLAHFPVAGPAKASWREATEKLDPKQVKRVEVVRAEKTAPPETGRSRG